jgi:hypothetical protein
MIARRTEKISAYPHHFTPQMMEPCHNP